MQQENDRERARSVCSRGATSPRVTRVHFHKSPQAAFESNEVSHDSMHVTLKQPQGFEPPLKNTCCAHSLMSYKYCI